ncbi:MAG: hypothetical protein ACI3VA_08045, partial [Candidatus Limivicinus sp.]
CDQQQREKTRKRVERHRAKKKAAGNDGVTPDSNSTCNVTVTPCNATTIPNHTIPYHTNIYDGDDECAGAREASEDVLARIGLKHGEYLGVSSGTVCQVERITADLITKYMGRDYTSLDCKIVFQYVCLYVIPGGGYSVNDDAADLLEYAFEQAQIAGFGCDWRYVRGIMDRLAARDIHTRAEAEAFDAERPDREE